MHRKMINPLITMALMLSTPALASLADVDCREGAEDGVAQQVDCRYIYDVDKATGAANPDEKDLNALGVFGLSNWTAIGKVESDQGSVTDGTFSLTTDPAQWGFGDDIWDEYASVALVIKAGNHAINAQGDRRGRRRGNRAGNGVYAYQIRVGETAGEWSTEGPFGGSDLSYMASYGAVSVPAPGALGLLAGGVLGLTMVRRQTRRATVWRSPASQSIDVPVA